MRINHSPNWRALAVLGALLSVIIVWPTVLSMPMLTARTPRPSSSSTTNTTTTDQPPSSGLLLNLTVAASNEYNKTQVDSNYSEREQTTNYSEYSDYGNNGSYLHQLNVSTFNDEYLTHDRGDIDPLYVSMTDSNSKLEVNASRRVRKSPNMDYDSSKRKRKKVNDDVSNTTYLSSASISDDKSSLRNSNNLSVSVSDTDYQSERTRNQSDRSEQKHSDDYDDSEASLSTQQTSTWRYYLSTTTPSYDIDVTSESWNFEETSNDEDITSTSSTVKSTTTLTQHTEYPVLSRTDRSVHIKRGITERQRGKLNGGQAVNGEGGSIKSRRLHIHNKNLNYRNNNNQPNSNSSSLDRNERSTISHISGPGRKIQLYIKNRFIQLMPDGTVNGTQDDLSDYTILQRTTVDVGRIKIQGVATCLYLCMDQCGAVYGSKEFIDDCVFNESMEQHNYNTYSSTYNSNSRRTYYLALNRHGEPRKLQIPPSRTLGKLATYTKAITETVAQDRVETLIAKKFGANRVKHGIRQLCDTGKPLVELTDKILKPRPQCTATNSNSNSNSSNNSNKNGQLNVPVANDKSRLSNLTNSSSSSSSSSSSNNSSSSNGHTSSNINNNHVIKKKKKRRRCRPGENEDEHNCQRGGPQAMKKRPANANNNNKAVKCKDATPETAVECQKRPKKGGGGKKHNNGGVGGGPKHNGAKQNGGAAIAEGRRGGGGGGGKKLNQNGRQQQGGNNNNNSNKRTNGKQPKNGLGGGGRTTTTTTTTTVHPIKIARTPRSRSTPSSTTTTTTTTTTRTTTTAVITTTEPSVSSQKSELVSSSQILVNQTSSEAQNADDSEADDTSADEETGEAEEEADDDEAPNNDDELPYIGEHTQLVGGASDFLYDDELDL